MTKQVRKWLVFLTLIGIVLSLMLSCRLYDDRIELSKDDEWRFYSLNPETILESLAQGNTDVFTLIAVTSLAQGDVPALKAATPEGMPSVPAASVQWSQEDFFQVAQTLHEQSWMEPLGDLNLYNMLFHVNCADAERGTFSEAEFKSYNVIQPTGEEEIRIEHWITIRPLMNSAYTVEVAYQPNVNYKEPIELARYQVTAGEALQIAESSGGSAVRAEVGNDCEISVMAPGPDGKGWRVLYQNKAERYYLLFEIAIDPETGDYKVMYPKSK